MLVPTPTETNIYNLEHETITVQEFQKLNQFYLAGNLAIKVLPLFN